MLDYLELNHDWICKWSVKNILCYPKYQVWMFTYCFWNLLKCRTYNVMCKHSRIFEFIAFFILKMDLPINYVNLSFIGKKGPSFKTTLPLGGSCLSSKWQVHQGWVFPLLLNEEKPLLDSGIFLSDPNHLCNNNIQSHTFQL